MPKESRLAKYFETRRPASFTYGSVRVPLAHCEGLSPLRLGRCHHRVKIQGMVSPVFLVRVPESVPERKELHHGGNVYRGFIHRVGVNADRGIGPCSTGIGFTVVSSNRVRGPVRISILMLPALPPPGPGLTNWYFSARHNGVPQSGKGQCQGLHFSCIDQQLGPQKQIEVVGGSRLRPLLQ